MPRNGSGVYSLPSGNPVVDDTTIEASWANTTLSDIATEITGSLPRNGAAPMTGTLGMGNYKILNLADGTAATDAATKGQTDTALANHVAAADPHPGYLTEAAAASGYQAVDAELTAIAGLISSANKLPMFSGSGTATMIDFKDEDNMASNSATAVPSQQSVKAYADALFATLISGTFSGAGVAGTNVPTINSMSCHYVRVGNYVMISGYASIVITTANTFSTFYLPIPIASDFTGGGDLMGTMTSAPGTATAKAVGFINADAANNRMMFSFTPDYNSAAALIYFSGMYLVK